MHKFFHFAHLKSTFFYFTHLFLQNTRISLSIIHVYSNKIFISLPTQPPTHTDNPHWYHTGIHTTHWQKNKKNKPSNKIDAPGINTTQQHNPVTRNRNKPSNTIHITHRRKTRKTNPATRSTHPKSTQPSNTIHTIQQPGIETNPTTQSTQPTRNQRPALSNKIDTSGGDGENEKQDRHLQRQVVAMAMVRDIQPHSTRNPLINPIQPENNEKQTKKKQSAAAMAIDRS